MTETDPPMSLALAEKLADEIRRTYAAFVYVHPAGRVVMSESEWTWFEPAVWSDRSLDAVGRGYYLGAVPIDVRPDWMFNEIELAWLRLKAIIIRDLRIRHLVTWLARHLAPKETR